MTDSDMGGQFNNKNSGKRGMSLNIRHPRGLQIARDLVRVCDIVAEGFSPGVLDRLGLGYEVQRSIRPDIIYIQQSGMGSHGTYGRLRTVGPVAAAFAGTSEMSGLPEPAMPAGWGYSFLDWMGAYSYALALMGALHYRERTGQGQWIDASQCESRNPRSTFEARRGHRDPRDRPATGGPWSAAGSPASPGALRPRRRFPRARRGAGHREPAAAPMVSARRDLCALKAVQFVWAHVAEADIAYSGEHRARPGGSGRGRAWYWSSALLHRRCAAVAPAPDAARAGLCIGSLAADARRPAACTARPGGS
ncbi:MAG: CoA transferase [Acetobacteraceae bacterium]